MNTEIKRVEKIDWREEGLNRIYEGDVMIRTASTATQLLVDETRSLLEQAFGQPLQDPARARVADFWMRMVGLRRFMKTSPRFLFHASQIALDMGLDPSRTAFAPFRLRAILDGGHDVPVNASAYVVHRDTWYAHPQSVVVCWIPLFDVTEQETFFFYPDYFRRPVLPNDSVGFEYGSDASIALDRKIAAEFAESGKVAPTPEQATGLDLGPKLGFSARRGEQVLFSGAQLHATQRNDSGRTRFSVDCRFVNLDDHEAGRGAPNVDSQARGSALVDYIRPS